MIPGNVQVLINTYKASQMRLINIIAKSEARGNVTAYRRAVLSSVNQELRALDKFSARWAKKEIPLSYREGAEKAYNEIRKANIEIKKVAINTKTVRLLVDNATGQLQDATQFVGRRIADDLRQAGIEAVAEKLSAGDTVKQAKANLISKLNKQGVVAIRDKAGRQVSLDAYASMVARTTTREATNKGTINAVQDVDGDLVQMSSHASACPICQPLEGRVYSISGKSKKYPRLDIAFSGGYATIHPNCFIDAQTPIFTSKGWVAIGKIKLGDLVLSHKGKFRKVTKLHHNIGRPDIVRISARIVKDAFSNLTVTSEHPIMLNGEWQDAKNAKAGDVIRVLSHKCENCGKDIPLYKTHCDRKCAIKTVCKKRDTKEWHNNLAKAFGQEVLRVLANHNDEYTFIDIPIAKVSIDKARRTYALFNLSVDVDQSYIAKGYVVHNCAHVVAPYFPEFDDRADETIEESNRAFEIREKDKASIDAYNKDQAIKAERRRDRKLYEQVRLTVPNEAPKTFSGFRAMKRADSERYQQLRIAMNEATKP